MVSRSAVTALGVCAAEPRDDGEGDAWSERRRCHQMLDDLGRQWAGRNGRRRWQLRIYKAVVALGTPIRDVADDYRRTPRTIRRIVAEVQDGLVRSYRRPAGHPVETVLGIDADRDAA